MLELPHAIIGAVIGTKIGNPFLAFPLAILSNFLLDILPHWNPHLNTELKTLGHLSKRTTFIVIVDGLLGLVIGSLLAFRFYPDIERVTMILICCFLSVSADLIEAPYFFFKLKSPFILKWIALQKKIQTNVSEVPGILSQIIFLIICFWVIFN